MARQAFIQTYGCQMNEHDSFRMREILATQGYDFTNSIDDADLILVNTCSVRHNPENKVYSFLGTLPRLKQKRPHLIVGVAGCVAQQAGEEILKRSDVVNMVFGPDNYFLLPDMIAAAEKGERIVMTDFHRDREKVQNFIPDSWLEAGHVEQHKAYIAIMKGCNNFCSFCIVPYTRGREVSREMDNILAEARDLIAKGAREIWLLGQNVNSYKAGDAGFYELLEAASQLDGLKRLRFTSPHPKDWNGQLAELMAREPVICNQVHLPFQAGGNRILKKMNRRHSIEEYLAKVRHLRETVPSVEISTDIIVGFPSETEEEFQQTLRVLDEVRFSQVFSFKYSPRPGTKAAEMDDDVPREVKEDRLRRLIELQDRINTEALKAYVGTSQTLLIDGVHPKNPGAMNGRTDGYRPVSLPNAGAKLGDLVDVRITSVRGHWLEGQRLQ